MTRQQEIRDECLLQLYGARPLPLSTVHIRKVAKRQGFDYSEREIFAELEFLVGQNFAKQVPDAGTGVIKYAITSAGTLHHEQTEAAS